MLTQRIDMPSDRPGDSNLQAALEGHVPALAAKDAVYVLARSQGAAARDQLRELVRQHAAVAVRRRAALGLSLVVDARAALLELVDVDEPSVLAAVLLSLARVGTAEDVKTIRTAARRLGSPAAEQARFAELLLAHRLRLGPGVVPPVRTPAASQVPVNAHAVTPGSPQEAVAAWSRFVPHASLGFEPDSRRCAVIHCARRNILIIPSTELTTQGRERLLEERMLLAATAAYERENGTWHHDLWIFSTPTATGVELQAWTQGGRACYTGPGRVVEQDLAFELFTTASSHLALAHLRGRLTKDSIAVEGTVGDRDPSDARAPESRRPPA
jgi:hypothetical protein